jgi:hypothetical protein
VGEQGCVLNLALRIAVLVFGQGVVCYGRLVVSVAAWELGSFAKVILYGTLSFGGEKDYRLIAFVTLTNVYF